MDCRGGDKGRTRTAASWGTQHREIPRPHFCFSAPTRPRRMREHEDHLPARSSPGILRASLGASKVTGSFPVACGVSGWAARPGFSLPMVSAPARVRQGRRQQRPGASVKAHVRGGGKFRQKHHHHHTTGSGARRWRCRVPPVARGPCGNRPVLVRRRSRAASWLWRGHQSRPRRQSARGCAAASCGPDKSRPESAQRRSGTPSWAPPCEAASQPTARWAHGFLVALAPWPVPSFSSAYPPSPFRRRGSKQPRRKGPSREVGNFPRSGAR